MSEVKVPRRGTQPRTVLTHLQTNEYLTDVVCTGLYGIGQLASCVYKLRARGYNISTLLKKGVRGNYAEYRLVK